MGFEPMTATIRVSNGSLYDYIVIGEHPRARDNFDNAHDTISPGNLNADMGQPFISVVIPHPDWKPAMRELRGDIRVPARRQEWPVTIRTSLAKGTPLQVELQAEGTSLPKGMQLTLKDEKAIEGTDLRVENYTVEASGPGTITRLLIIAEQP